ncbi:MAG: putative hydrolase [Acidimicrobiaceae bacterium]|nr:putative hydrolase [Acidimicrobiaceae bacterium]
MTHQGERPERFAGHSFPQTIPEPRDIKVGRPAPWSSLPATSRRGLTLDTVRERLTAANRLLLTSSPPDAPEELGVVADDTPVPITQRSAVLAALFEEDGEAQLVLTRRAMSLRQHRGEIALPGGRCDEDETPTETALREAREEIGLEPSSVTPIAWLSPILTFASGSSIWPIVGTLARRPTFTIETAEVDRAFTVSLSDLVAEGAFVEERWRRVEARAGAEDEGYFPIYFFKVPGDIIWGATARVVAELLALATGASWPPITD